MSIKKNTFFLCYIIVIIGILLFSSCNQNSESKILKSIELADTLIYETTIDSGMRPVFTISNTSTNILAFRFSVNDKFWFTPESMLNYIYNMQADSIPNTDQLLANAYQFVVENTGHTSEINLEKKHRFSPGTFINSIGNGLCSNRGAVLANIWRALGYETHCVQLGSHLVPEVYNNGKWKLLDPDYCSYLLLDGDVASVEEIANYSSECEIVFDDEATNYFDEILPQKYLSFFTSVVDNEVQDWYMQGIDWEDTEMYLPKGAELSFPIENPNATKNYPYSFACLHIRDYTGFLSIPFAIHSVSGDGYMQIFPQEAISTKSNHYFYAPDTYYLRCKDLRIYLYINEHLLSNNTTTKLEIICNTPKAISIRSSESTNTKALTYWLQNYKIAINEFSAFYRTLFEESPNDFNDVISISSDAEFVEICSSFYKASRSSINVPDSINAKIEYTLEAIEKKNIDKSIFFTAISDAYSRNILMMIIIDLPIEAIDESLDYYSFILTE